MPLFEAESADLAAIAELVNSAYRGDVSRQGWTTEADYVGGQRTDPQVLARDLAADPRARLLVLRDGAGEPPLGCVMLKPAGDGAWYLGMLTVRPDIQDRQLGRTMLEGAEAYAKAQGAGRIRISVVQVRDTLIAWYERRGYAATGATLPFPYDDPEIGEPMRDDLHFVVMEKAV
jgi:ribosomal protein S18 acetylase RimI-like enzyme